MSRIAVVAVVTAICAVAQTKPQRMEYEVASVRPSPQMDGTVQVGMRTDGSQVRFNFLSLRDCIRIGWQLKDYQVTGPDWVPSVRFSISAKLPEGTFTDDQKREMLQHLLVDRFAMKYHIEKKEFAVYALMPGKNGIRMKETVADPATDSAPSKGLDIKASGGPAGVFVDLGEGAWYSFANNKLTGHKLSTTVMADVLGSYLDKPVVDLTGQPEAKKYDFALEITADDYRVMLIRTAIRNGVQLPPEVLRFADGTTESVNSALDLAGLRLNAQRAPLDVMVIDSANKTPGEN